MQMQQSYMKTVSINCAFTFILIIGCSSHTDH